MMKRTKPYIIFLVSLLFLLYLPKNKLFRSTAKIKDFKEIKVDSLLRVGLRDDDIEIIINEKEKVNRSQYQLLKEFAQEHKLRLEVTHIKSKETAEKDLINGVYDIVAEGTISNSQGLKDSSIVYSNPIGLSRLILVQRKAQLANDSDYIKSQLQLANETVYVSKSSRVRTRIKNLSNEIADTIYIAENHKYDNKRLLSMLEKGEINYIVCDENTAKEFAKNSTIIDYSLPIGFKQIIAWKLRKSSTALIDSVNIWIDRKKNKH